MITIKIEVLPFEIPTTVRLKANVGRRQDGFQKGSEVPLSELDLETLEMLCDKFKSDVLAAATEQREDRIRR